MRFGFDIDGTIGAAPDQFRTIMLALLAAGHEVHVITGKSTPITEEDYEWRRHQLEVLGILPSYYTHLHIAGPPNWVADKAQYCRDNGIAFMFEDDVAYAQAICLECPVTVMWKRR